MIQEVLQYCRIKLYIKNLKNERSFCSSSSSVCGACGKLAKITHTGDYEFSQIHKQNEITEPKMVSDKYGILIAVFMENYLPLFMEKYLPFTAVTAGDFCTGFHHFIGASMGDQINNYFIWTDNTHYGTPGTLLTHQQLSLPLPIKE